jgi:hypothetical protein
MFAKLAARDLAIAAIALLAWQLAAPLSAGSGAVGDVSGVVLGFLAGAVAYLAHEYGHLLGAVAARSRVQPGKSLYSPSVFTFESRSNSRAQFLAMSFGGFAATAVAVWVVYAVLPSELLATRVVRGLVLFLTGLAFVLEVPLVIYSLLTRRVPPIDGLEPRKPAEQAAA